MKTELLVMSPFLRSLLVEIRVIVVESLKMTILVAAATIGLILVGCSSHPIFLFMQP